MIKQGPESRISIAAPLITMILLGLVFGGAAYFYLKNQALAADQKVHSHLSLAAHSKAMQIAAWRAGWAGDARVIAMAFHVAPLLQSVLRGDGSIADRLRATELLTTVKTQYGYAGITLASNEGKPILSIGTGADLDTLAPKMRVDDFPDFFFGQIQRIGGSDALQMNVLSRIRDGRGKALGFVILTIDPKAWLLPSLWDWPNAGPSGRLVLVVREGNEAVLLNEPRLPAGLKPSATFAMRSRLPIKNLGLSAVQAILKKDGPVDGMDIWGTPVVAVASSVPGSDWHVVANMDRREAFAEQGPNTWRLVYLVLVSMLLSGAAVELFFRRRSQQFFREKSNAQLKHNELRGRYDSLNRYASDAILIWDEDANILEANDSALRLFGYTREELTGKSLAVLKPPGYADEYLQNFKRIVPNEAVVFETIDMRKNGQAFPAEVSSCLINIDGRLWGQSFIRDITERKRTEEQINRLNRIYAVLSRCNYAAFHALDEDELFQNVCRITAEAGGFQVGWVGRVDTEAGIISPIAAEGEAASYIREITITLGGVTGQGPVGICVREGKTVGCNDFREDPRMLPWRETALRHGLRSSINLPITRGGKPVFVFGIYSSTAGFFGAQETSLAEEVGACLTETLARFDLQQKRHQAELEREQATERLERAFEIAHEGYWDWLIPTNEHYASPRYCALMGFEVGEAVIDFDFVRESVHPDDRPLFEERHQSLWEGRTNEWAARYRVRHKDGHYVWVQGRAGVVSRDSDGRPTRIVKTSLDISEQKLLEQEFLQAQKMDSVGRLAGGIAHDFNNHLTVMIGYSELLRETLPTGSKMSEILNTVIESGDRAAALTRQLLAFSRKEVEQREPISPNEVITAIHKMLSHLTGQRVQLCFDLYPSVGFVLMDQTHLEQIVMNLTVNARDAIATEGKVTISTRVVHARDRNFLRLSVIDNGCGITPEVREHMFEPFFTTKHHSHGTGLGLATVYGIVERSEGFIEVESEPGHGTTLHVYIPILESCESITSCEGEAVSRMGAGQAILVVEDEEPVRRLAADALRRYAYRPVLAENCAQALSIISNSNYRIQAAVIDLVLPGMNGADLGEELLRIRPDIKVVYASGYADDANHLGELLANGGAFLPKPYKPEDLAAALAKIFSRYAHEAI